MAANGGVAALPPTPFSLASQPYRSAAVSEVGSLRGGLGKGEVKKGVGGERSAYYFIEASEACLLK